MYRWKRWENVWVNENIFLHLRANAKKTFENVFVDGALVHVRNETGTFPGKPGQPIPPCLEIYWTKVWKERNSCSKISVKPFRLIYRNMRSNFRVFRNFVWMKSGLGSEYSIFFRPYLHSHKTQSWDRCQSSRQLGECGYIWQLQGWPVDSSLLKTCHCYQQKPVEPIVDSLSSVAAQVPACLTGSIVSDKHSMCN